LKISREVKAAVLVISGLLLIVYLFNYLKGQNLLDSSRTFYAIYDNVEGLTASAPITISGNVVGKVQEIAFTDDNSGKLQLKLMIDDDFKFSKNSKAEIYEAGLIGGKAIAILLVNDGSETAVDGDFLEGTVKAGLTELVNQKLTPLQGKIEDVMVSADSLLGNINDVFDKQTKANLRNSITQLNQTITSFKTTSSSLNSLISDNKEKLDSTITSFESTSANLASLTDEMAKANLGQTITELQTTITSFKNMLSAIEKGEGSLGKLMKDDGLYNNLEGATKELEELLKDIKLHPKRYFRVLSKKEIPYNEN